MKFVSEIFTFDVSSEEERKVTLCMSGPGVFGEKASYYNNTPVLKTKEKELHVPATVMYEGKEYTVTRIVEDAFRGLSQLEDIYLPATINFFDWCLWGCNNLQNIFVDEKNGKFMSVDGVLFEKKARQPYKLVAYPLGREGKYTLPKSVKQIGGKAFKCCKISELELHPDLGAIGPNAFYRCKNLKEVELPDNLTELGKAQDDTTVDYIYKNRHFGPDQYKDLLSLLEESKS